MRTLMIAAVIAVLPATPVLAQQGPAGAAPTGEPLLVKSIEPDLSTDPASIDDLRHKMNKDKRQQVRTKADQARPAQPAEILAGKEVHDTAGQVIALIEKVDAEGAILRSGQAVVRVPLEGFGMNKKGLLLNLTKPQFDQMIATSAAAAPRS